MGVSSIGEGSIPGPRLRRMRNDGAGRPIISLQGHESKLRVQPRPFVRTALKDLDFMSARDVPADILAQANAWPFEEARKLVKRVERTGQGSVLFETGYGPSGLPH